MSNAIDPADFLSNLLALFDETVQGSPQDAPGTYYLDRNAGWRQTLADLTAAEAGTPAFPGATTIASQAAHARYNLRIVLGFMRGEEPERDWPGSFEPSAPDEAAWNELRTGLLDTCDTVRSFLSTGVAEWNDDRIGDAIALVVHTAYHLGAVRQLARALAARQ